MHHGAPRCSILRVRGCISISSSKWPFLCVRMVRIRRLGANSSLVLCTFLPSAFHSILDSVYSRAIKPVSAFRNTFLNTELSLIDIPSTVVYPSFAHGRFDDHTQLGTHLLSTARPPVPYISYQRPWQSSSPHPSQKTPSQSRIISSPATPKAKEVPAVLHVNANVNSTNNNSMNSHDISEYAPISCSPFL
ncbi:hypothetical protein PAXRUDRAFT_221402 [Paxillus rubicundulus Ve08.2h10]|uniref:Uncharacterized protein n=1 Tax=Paxillus rubicundulus Ve08.2h10 TaxID=930991 RepID=A0A0D0DTW4_9AGAM|nr:hypothetical protein PAXRUDRAFT_221402 [Paxillus rubicundulus Ve08.2h10]